VAEVVFPYVVHGVNPVKKEATVIYQGMEVKAEVLALEVELVAVETGNGSIVFRLSGADVDLAKEICAADAEVELVLRTKAP
jgi:hypothetical protein